MTGYQQGQMNYAANEKTFRGFVKFVTRAVIAILVFLVFLAIVGG